MMVAGGENTYYLSRPQFAAMKEANASFLFEEFSAKAICWLTLPSPSRHARVVSGVWR